MESNLIRDNVSAPILYRRCITLVFSSIIESWSYICSYKYERALSLSLIHIHVFTFEWLQFAYIKYNDKQELNKDFF